MPTTSPYSLWVVACTNSAQQIWLRNATKAAALHVVVTSGWAYLTPAPSPVRETFSEFVVAQAAPTVRHADGTVTLAPGDSLTTAAATAEDYVVDMVVDRRSTVIASVAAATAENMADRLKSPSRRVADSIADCGTSAGTVVDSGIELTPESIFQAAYAGNQCRMAFDEFNRAVFTDEVDNARVTGRQGPTFQPPAVQASDAPSLTTRTLDVAERSPALRATTLRSLLDATTKAAFRLIAS